MARARVKFNVRRTLSKNRLVLSKTLNALTDEMTADLQRVLTRKQYPPASRPGQIPAARRGLRGGLAANTRVTRRGRQLFVSTTDVGIFLDGGTRNMAPRPWIRRRINDRRAFWTQRAVALAKKFRR